MHEQRISKALGRPRSFQEAEALDAAVRVFWRDGYEGASLRSLTKAMGINRPSLYAAFGDKKGLFLQVLDRYEQIAAAYVGKALKEPTARSAVEALMRGAAELTTSARNPRGCLFVQGALACSEDAADIQRELSRRRSAGEKALRLRLKRAQTEGDLPQDVHVAGLARYIVTVVHGIGVQAASGARRAELLGVIETALQAWPKATDAPCDPARARPVAAGRKTTPTSAQRIRHRSDNSGS